MQELFATGLLELHQNGGRLSDETVYALNDVLGLNEDDEDEDTDKDKDTDKSKPAASASGTKTGGSK